MNSIKAILLFLSVAFLSAAIWLIVSDEENFESVTGNKIINVKFDSTVKDVSIYENSIYVVLENANVFKYNLNAELQASLKLDSDSISSKISFCNGLLVLSDIDGQVFAISKDLKNVVWKKSFGEKICGNFFYKDSMLVFGSYNQCLYAIDANTGDEIFKIKTSDAINANPAFYKNFAVLGNCAGEIVCVDLLEKKLLWKNQFGSHIPLSPVAVSDILIVANYSGELVSYRFSDGVQIWKNENLKISPMVQIVSDSKNSFYAMSQDGNLFIINAKDSGVVKKENFGSNKAEISLKENELMLSFKSGLIYILNGDNLTEIFKYDTLTSNDVCDFNKCVIVSVDSTDTMRIIFRE